MTTYDELGHLLRTHLAERADGRPTEGALDAILAVTAGVRPRRQGLIWLRGGWVGTGRLTGASRPLAVALLLTIGLVAALVLGALLAGALRIAVAPSLPHRNGAILILQAGAHVAVNPASGATSDYGGVTCTPGRSLCADADRTRRLLDFESSGASVSWSPDGTKLASQYGGAVWVLDPTATDAVRDTTRVTSADATQPWPHQLVSWSPDGSHLAFAAGGEIVTVNVDGSQRTQVTHFGGSPVASQPAWSPDGSRIAFALSSPAGTWSIDTINVDGTNLRAVVGPYVSPQDPLASSPAWSPDGSRIAYLEDTSAAQVVTIRPDGSDRTVIFTVPSCCVTDLGDVAWSPDGTQIATILIGSPPARDWSLYIMDASGAHAVELAHHVKPGFPAWQPIP